MNNEGQKQLQSKNIPHSHLLTSLSSRKQENRKYFQESNLQVSQQLELNQNQKGLIPQIRSQQSSPLGFPQSRAFSQSCKRYKVKVNTNSSAIPKDFFYDTNNTNEINSAMIQGKENNSKYSNDSQLALLSFTNQYIEAPKQGVTNQFIKNYERAAQSSMAKYSMNDSNTPYRFLKQRNNFKKPNNNFNADNFAHQKLEIQLPDKCDKDFQINEINNANQNFQHSNNQNESNQYQDSSTPKFVEKKQLFNNLNSDSNQITARITNIKGNSQRNLFENQSLQKDFIKRQLLEQDLIQQNASPNEYQKNNDISAQDFLIKRNSSSQFQFKGMNEIPSNNNDNSTQNIIQSVQQKLKNFNTEDTLSKLKSNKENSLSSNRKNILQLISNQGNNTTSFLDNLSQAQSTYKSDKEIDLKISNNNNYIGNQPDQNDQQKNQFYRIIRKRISNTQEDQNYDTTPVKRVYKDQNEAQQAQTTKDSNRIANMITLTNEFIFNKEAAQSETSKQVDSECRKMSLNNRDTNSLENFNSKNIYEEGKQINENMISNKRYRNISNPALNTKNNTNQITQNTQGQNCINQANNCQKLGNNLKNQPIQMHHQLQIQEQESFQSDKNIINKILENRSTTTSHLTKRQQMLYLQSTLKKRNQHSLHEDTQTSKNQSLYKQQLLNYFTENNNQQKPPSMSKTKLEQTPDFINQLNLNQSFEKVLEQNFYQARTTKKDVENQQNVESLPRIYPIKVKNKESKEKIIGLSYMQKQNLGQYQQQINSPTYGIITNISQLANTQTNTSISMINQGIGPDQLQFQQYSNPLPFMIGGVNLLNNNISQRDKSRTANSSPISGKLDLFSSRREFQLFKSDKYVQQNQNNQQKNLIKIEQDFQDI